MRARVSGTVRAFDSWGTALPVAHPTPLTDAAIDAHQALQCLSGLAHLMTLRDPDPRQQSVADQAVAQLGQALRVISELRPGDSVIGAVVELLSSLARRVESEFAAGAARLEPELPHLAISLAQGVTGDPTEDHLQLEGLMGVTLHWDLDPGRAAWLFTQADDQTASAKKTPVSNFADYATREPTTASDPQALTSPHQRMVAVLVAFIPVQSCSRPECSAAQPQFRTPADFPGQPDEQLESVLGTTPPEFESRILRRPEGPHRSSVRALCAFGGGARRDRVRPVQPLRQANADTCWLLLSTDLLDWLAMMLRSLQADFRVVRRLELLDRLGSRPGFERKGRVRSIRCGACARAARRRRASAIAGQIYGGYGCLYGI